MMLPATDYLVITAVPVVAQCRFTLCCVVAACCSLFNMVTYSRQLMLCSEALLLSRWAAVGCHVYLVLESHQLGFGWAIIGLHAP